MTLIGFFSHYISGWSTDSSFKLRLNREKALVFRANWLDKIFIETSCGTFCYRKHKAASSYSMVWPVCRVFSQASLKRKCQSMNQAGMSWECSFVSGKSLPTFQKTCTAALCVVMTKMTRTHLSSLCPAVLQII